ncbi:helix-turn-helix domain-containing protein [Niallia sp. 03133]|uniref:helix-turn-helix domain-containing protein n=1 Tax=Niallia sp. 03133 TaxID=3458060 RepID=UPI0040441370
MKTVGQRIKEKRKALGFTQGDLSDRNLSRGMISLIERDQTTPSIKTLEHIAIKLGVPTSELLGESLSAAEKQANIHMDIVEIKRIINLCKALMKAGKYSNINQILQNIILPNDLSFYNGPIKKILGLVEIENLHYKNAIELLNESLLYYSPMEGKNYISLYYYLSECYKKTKNYHLAIENSLYGSILLKSKHYEDDVLLQLKILYNLAYCYCRISEYKKGLEVIEESFHLMKKSQLLYAQGYFYMLKGIAELYLMRFSEGIVSTRKALELLEDKKDSKESIGCLTNLGILYRNVKKYDDSLLYLEKSLISAEELKHNGLFLNNLYEMMLTYYKVKNYALLESCAERALLISSSSPDIKTKVLIVLAQSKLDQGMDGEALTYINQAEKISKEINDTCLEAKSCTIKANILSNQKQFEEANRLLQKSNHLLMNMSCFKND